MAYDLRQMRALSPVTTLVYPLLLKFLPSYSSRLAVVSPLGQMQLLDTIYANVQPPMTCLYQVNVLHTREIDFGENIPRLHCTKQISFVLIGCYWWRHGIIVRCVLNISMSLLRGFSRFHTPDVHKCVRTSV